MILYTLSTGDKVYRYQKSIVIKFLGDRKVLSTSHINGGYRENLEAVFNYDSNPEEGAEYCMRTDSYENDLRIVAKELGLCQETTAGITTAVSMENVSIKAASYEDLTVTAIVTAGIDGNAGRVGDPAYFHERKGEPIQITEGTINIILSIDADMTPGTIARCIVTCTEAKTAALQELMAGSIYSSGLATGSGTDETIIICNSRAKNQLKFAGKHSKLGELIGLTVKSAVKEALFLQTGLSGERQHNVLRRMERFGIDENDLWLQYNRLEKENKYTTKNLFKSRLDLVQENSDLVTLTSLYTHLLDQLVWELLSSEEVAKESTAILAKISAMYDINIKCEVNKDSIDQTMVSMIDNFKNILVEII